MYTSTAEMATAAIVDALGTAGWSVTPHFVPPDEAATLAADGRALWQRGLFHQAGIGRETGFMVRPDIRGDEVLWLDPPTATPAQQRYLDRMETLRLAINQHLYLGLFRYEAHVARYPPGAFFQRHLDRHRDSPSPRVLSCVLYLNDGWAAADGGQLRLYLTDAPDAPYVDVYPEAGTLVTFFSDRFYHEVLPASRERLSVTGWFAQRS